VDAVGGSRFTVGYELYDGAELAARARTGLVPYDLATSTLRRLNAGERAVLTAQLTPAEPLRPVATVSVADHDHHRWPLSVRWSDLDSYGHANNVKYFDYIQEGRVAMMGPIFPWTPEELWVVVRQDVEYRRPIDFRTAPYEVATVVSELGNRSFTLAAEIRDPQDGTTYASGRTVIVRPKPLTDEQRFALSAFAALRPTPR
jgi:acyl-CoA thioester hydrolase